MAAKNDMPLPGAQTDALLTGGTAVKAEKAAWFREVLALEPGSKIFLPYARLLADIGRSEEAVTALQEGLLRHPEFIEARLLLIDLLYKIGNTVSCGSEVAQLANLFREYPGFWEAWSSLSASMGQRPDLAVSLSFLGAQFRDSDLTLIDVMAAGLKAMQGQESEPHTADLSRPVDVDCPAHPPFVYGASGFQAGSEAADQAADDSGGHPEKCSLRTRSMADILAEQGDVRGAMNIYEELMAACESDELPDLRNQFEHLKTRLGDEANAEPAYSSATAPAYPKNGPGNPQNGVLDMLERLAVRLETKARQ